MSLSLINGSDGTGEAVVATVSAARTTGSMSISVSSLTHWPASFVATGGKQLSGGVLSTPLVFSGHKSGTNTIVIDTIAPGYTDAGNAVGDIIVLKPSTMWADNIATTLGASLNDDGSLKNTIVNGANIVNGGINYANLLSTIFSGQVTSYTNTGSAGGTGYYINLGGIKICWGVTNSQTSSNPGTSYTVTLPSGFFTTVQSFNVTAVGVTTAANQFIDHTGSINTGINALYFCSPSGAAAAQASWIAIGT